MLDGMELICCLVSSPLEGLRFQNRYMPLKMLCELLVGIIPVP